MAFSSKDAQYDYYYSEGDVVKADTLLETYVDWRDISSYPSTSRVDDEIAKRAKQQKDPTTKKGVVGAFCRTYNIHEAIETFLAEIYRPEPNERYTYIKGSTSAGLVTYEDTFTYSHHGTDPTSGLLCNSFDLVRVHKFGHLDAESTVRTPQNKPSYKEMERLCQKDAQVKKTIGREALQSARYEFDDLEELAESENHFDWMEGLEVDAKGKYLSSANNLNLIFSEDPVLKEAFRYNTFDAKRYIAKSMPWEKNKKEEPIKNVDYAGIRNYIESIYEYRHPTK